MTPASFASASLNNTRCYGQSLCLRSLRSVSAQRITSASQHCAPFSAYRTSNTPQRLSAIPVHSVETHGITQASCIISAGNGSHPTITGALRGKPTNHTIAQTLLASSRTVSQHSDHVATNGPLALATKSAMNKSLEEKMKECDENGIMAEVTSVSGSNKYKENITTGAGDNMYTNTVLMECSRQAGAHLALCSDKWNVPQPICTPTKTGMQLAEGHPSLRAQDVVDYASEHDTPTADNTNIFARITMHGHLQGSASAKGVAKVQMGLRYVVEEMYAACLTNPGGLHVRTRNVRTANQHEHEANTHLPIMQLVYWQQCCLPDILRHYRHSATTSSAHLITICPPFFPAARMHGIDHHATVDTNTRTGVTTAMPPAHMKLTGEPREQVKNTHATRQSPRTSLNINTPPPAAVTTESPTQAAECQSNYHGNEIMQTASTTSTHPRPPAALTLYTTSCPPSSPATRMRGTHHHAVADTNARTGTTTATPPARTKLSGEPQQQAENTQAMKQPPRTSPDTNLSSPAAATTESPTQATECQYNYHRNEIVQTASAHSRSPATLTLYTTHSTPSFPAARMRGIRHHAIVDTNACTGTTIPMPPARTKLPGEPQVHAENTQTVKQSPRTSLNINVPSPAAAATELPTQTAECQHNYHRNKFMQAASEQGCGVANSPHVIGNGRQPPPIPSCDQAPARFFCIDQ